MEWATKSSDPYLAVLVICNSCLNIAWFWLTAYLHKCENNIVSNLALNAP